MEINHKRILSDNLRILRKQLGMSQESFSSIFHVNRDKIASYERGSEPKLSFLLDVSNYFDIKLDDLITCDLNTQIDLLSKKENRENKQLTTEKTTLEMIRELSAEIALLKKEVEDLKKKKKEE